MAKQENLWIETEIQSDILALAPEIGQEVYDFIKLLAKNPNTVAIVPKPVEVSEDHFYHRLPSGCLVFWELIHGGSKRDLSVLRQDGEIIHVTGAGFGFPKGFGKFTAVAFP